MMTSSNETFSTLLALYAGNPSVTGEFPSQGPVTQSFDVFFNLRPNKRLSKQSWACWRHRADYDVIAMVWTSLVLKQPAYFRRTWSIPWLLMPSCVARTPAALVLAVRGWRSLFLKRISNTRVTSMLRSENLFLQFQNGWRVDLPP